MTFCPEFQFGIDLVEAAIAQRQFLRIVDDYPSLYAGPHVRNAIRRYELFWLPLLAQYATRIKKWFIPLNVAAPLDIAWVWHVHMLSPVDYQRDCNEIVATLVDHKILVGEQRDKGLVKARALWEKVYPEEPFEADLAAPVCDAPDFQSRIEYDIEAACARQRVFNYQVSLPHFADKRFLTEAVKRYKLHLYLKQKNPELFFVPCYDFDLIWHAHQLNPLIYTQDTTEILGKVYDHNDSVNDRRPGSQLSKSETVTREKWKNLGQIFALNGAMFRGEPPHGTQKESIDYSLHGAFEYTVDLTMLEVEGLPKSKTYTVKIEDVNGSQVLKVQVRGPAARVTKSNGVLSRFAYKKKNSGNLRVRIQQHGTCSCFSHLLDESAEYYFSAEYLAWRVSYKSNVVPQPETHELTIAGNLIVRFTTVVHPPQPDEYIFTVMPNGDFSPVQDAASILSSPALFLSPCSLNQTLASSEMSMHRLLDYWGREAFTCRVMHSAELLFSSVEVMNRVGNVVSTAHLLSENILPTKEQVGKPDFCCTLNEAGGVRAILIRGCIDWGICIGKWKGAVKGVPGVPGIKGSEGSPGVKGTPGVKGQPGDLCIKFFSLSGAQEWKKVKKRGENFRVSLSKKEIVNVNLRTGVISFAIRSKCRTRKHCTGILYSCPSSSVSA